MEIKLQQRLSQQLVMTQQLQQAIKLLQMTSAELETFVEEEMLENPTLESIDDNELTFENPEWDSSLPDDGTVPPPDFADDEKSAEPLSESQAADFEEPEPAGEGDIASDVAREMGSEVDWEGYHDPDEYVLTAEAGVGRDSPEITSFENYVSHQTTLIEHLEWQISVGSQFNKDELFIARRLIGALDERGYCPADVVFVVAAELDVPEDTVEAILFKIQELDPLGVGSRTLQECLTVQARLMGVSNQLVFTIIADYLDNFSSGKIGQIAKATKHTETEIKEALRQISQLEPYPARNFSYTPAVEVRPDVAVIRDDGEFRIIVEGNGRSLRVSQEYKQMAKVRGKTAAKTYLQDRLGRAKWLVDAIHTREETLKMVTRAIVERQREFFETGESRTLKPLILREIAETLEFNESTISRATANKYIQTEHGIFPMRYFFSTGIASDSAEDVSSQGVRQTIADLVKQENPAKPLSDQQLVAELKNRGINIARRTVAKYRESLNIPSSSDRKKSF